MLAVGDWGGPGLIRREAARAAWRAHPGRPLPAYRQLLDTQWWEPKALGDLQLRALRSLLTASLRVPFYRRRFAENQLEPAEICSVADLVRLPPLERDEIVRLGPSGLSARSFRGSHQSSSGSSGMPVEVVWPLQMLGWVHATERRARDWLGAPHGERRLVVRAGRTQRFHRAMAALYNVTLVSASALADPDYLEGVLRGIERQPPVSITGLSNGLYLLADRLLNDKISLRVRACQSGGNHLPDLYRETVESAFGCAVRQHYATVETGLIAHECAESGLHVTAELTLVEILRDGGAPADTGEVGDVVVTTLRNHRMPLIRYRTGDRAAFSPTKCSCGRALPVLDPLVGRANELIWTVDGTALVPEAVSKVLTGARASVVEYQIVQRPDRHLEVQVLQRDEPDATRYRAQIAGELDRLLGCPGMTHIERVERIAVSRAGKLRHIVSHAAH